MKSLSKRKWALALAVGLLAVLTGIHRWQQLEDEAHGSALLLAAARAGDRIGVLTWLDNGGYTNAVDSQGQTPLMLAAARGDIDIARSLLDAGASANGSDPHGNTALMQAVGAGNASLVALLIFWKADVNARREDGATALTLAQQKQANATAQQDSRRKDIARMLVRAGARE